MLTSIVVSAMAFVGGLPLSLPNCDGRKAESEQKKKKKTPQLEENLLVPFIIQKLGFMGI